MLLRLFYGDKNTSQSGGVLELLCLLCVYAVELVLH